MKRALPFPQPFFLSICVYLKRQCFTSVICKVAGLTLSCTWIEFSIYEPLICVFRHSCVKQSQAFIVLLFFRCILLVNVFLNLSSVFSSGCFCGLGLVYSNKSCTMPPITFQDLPLNIYMVIFGTGIFVFILSLVFCCYFIR